MAQPNGHGVQVILKPGEHRACFRHDLYPAAITGQGERICGLFHPLALPHAGCPAQAPALQYVRRQSSRIAAPGHGQAGPPDASLRQDGNDIRGDGKSDGLAWQQC
jgi:hypothetical protein